MNECRSVYNVDVRAEMHITLLDYGGKLICVPP